RPAVARGGEGVRPVRQRRPDGAAVSPVSSQPPPGADPRTRGGDRGRAPRPGDRRGRTVQRGRARTPGTVAAYRRAVRRLVERAAHRRRRAGAELPSVARAGPLT